MVLPTSTALALAASSEHALEVVHSYCYEGKFPDVVAKGDCEAVAYSEDPDAY